MRENAQSKILYVHLTFNFLFSYAWFVIQASVVAGSIFICKIKIKQTF